jgi:hypothetical protein
MCFFLFTLVHLIIVVVGSVFLHFIIRWSGVAILFVVRLRLAFALHVTFLGMVSICIAISIRIDFIFVLGGIWIFWCHFFFGFHINFCLIIIDRCLFPFGTARTGVCHDDVRRSIREKG